MTKRYYRIGIALAVIGIIGILIYLATQFSHYADDTLGGWPDRTFPISKQKLEKAIDTLYSYNPEYKVPAKWKEEDSSIMKSYFYLPSKTFYFNDPEEMYYVTFIGDSTMLADSTKITIAIRSVNYDGYSWSRYVDIKDTSERMRIEKRFDNEIISRLEKYTKTQAVKGASD